MNNQIRKSRILVGRRLHQVLRQPVIVLMLLAPLASAQVALDPGESSRARHDFETRTGEEALRCEVTPLGPVLNLAFRFQAGYLFHVPQSLYSSSNRGWVVFTAITPEDAPGDTTYLLGRSRLSDVVRVGPDFEIYGDYFLGPGRYSVESTLRDDRNGFCRKEWHVVVKQSHANRGVPVALPPNAVRQFAAISWPDTQHRDSAAPMRLSVLLNATAFSPRHIVIRQSDLEEIAGAFTALLEHLPTTSVRVVVFSLEQQREVFRSDRFAPSDITRLVEAIAALRTTAVDVSVLQNPLGHVAFLAGLIGRELNGPDPADTAVFLGPTSRYENKIPRGMVPSQGQAHTRFFYVRYETPLGIPALRFGSTASGTDQWNGEAVGEDPTLPKGYPISKLASPPSTQGLPDIITAAVSELKGKTLIVQTPADLAKAIQTIERKP
jgi:hypothetical protein